jgi:hypothetical protein
MKFLKIGVKLYGGKVLPIGKDSGFLVMGMEKAKSLTQYLKGEIGTADEWFMDRMVSQTIDAIRHGINKGFFFADIKPDNLLVVGDSVFLSDFEPRFTVKNNAWIKTVAERYGSSSIRRSSRQSVKELLFRAMMFQMHQMLLKAPKSHVRAKEFAENLYETGILPYLKQERKPIVLGNKKVPYKNVLMHALGNDARNTTYPEVLAHYLLNKRDPNRQILEHSQLKHYFQNFARSDPTENEMKPTLLKRANKKPLRTRLNKLARYFEIVNQSE